MIKLNQRVKLPANIGGEKKNKTGRVIFINKEHGFFVAEFTAAGSGATYREAYSFNGGK